ncbi:CocE/NonD family hydrolase [Chryseobacterium indologenes]|uniref:CocE/NonD family hydrolase n=1 Tax=Chryseobacterium indologenes TaxID=253 RepID=UPI000F4F4589|nr:CocE/NonD family hydrolase [Chryseobacterium indologenes]AYZ35350.1 CocE/NonD family hydrolase [Chryseobacterium indologenes]MBF6644094.1 CocE/NonD family hydrolase [Chryseobacterium indologenes]MBU3048038.1 CocE/NonD family hydrolase [Chryseobacterium indologenes]MEB4763303.1 CocE/NonD family hydrolase [Chryseobacterium indologenes]QQQ72187.1 CocE/NonD family hydrolase [Chryseobacterium indologenes]
MKFKILLALIFVNLIQAQKFYFPKTTVTDSVILDKQMPQLALKVITQLQSAKYKPENKVDYLDNLFRLQMATQDYQQSIASLSENRSLFADHNMGGYRLMGFELYSRAKLAQKENNMTFSNALQKVFNQKYDRLPEKLIPRLGLSLDANVPESRKQFKKILNKQKDKDSIDYKTALALCKAYVSYKTFSGIKPQVMQLLVSKDKERFITETKDITLKNGNTLTITIVRKKQNTTPLPVILTSNIYAGQIDDFFGKRAATYNYVGAVVNTRGKRNSNNVNNPFEHESEDIYDVIDWVSKQPWSNGKVGMIGGSYLGFSQWAAVKKLHPALKTIVPQVAVGIGIDYPAQNNIFMSYMLQWIQYVTNNKLTDEADFTNAAKWDSINTKWYKSGKAFRSLDSISGKPSKIFQRWLDHPGYDQYWQKMIPYKEDFSKINIPILTTTGYYDDDQIGALYYYKEHHQYNKNADHYVVIGPYNHGGAQSFGFTYVNGNPIDPVARISIDDLAFSWFDYILKGGKKPDLLKDRINFQVMNTNTWKHVSGLDKMHTSTLKFYLQDLKNTSSVFNKPGKKDFTSQTVDFTIRDDKDTYYKSGKKDSIKTTNSIVFESEVLDKEMIFSGNISGFFNVSINKKDFDTETSLYQIQPDGKSFLLSTHMVRASYAKDNAGRKLLTPDVIEQIPVNNSIFMSKKIEKGSKLLLLVGVNKNPNWQINYGTGKNVSDETVQDAGKPLEIKWYNDSYVEIPVYKD